MTNTAQQTKQYGVFGRYGIESVWTLIHVCDSLSDAMERLSELGPSTEAAQYGYRAIPAR
jgi:hypothetical protein